MGYADDYICEPDTVIIGRKGNINKPIYVETPFWNVDTAFGLSANTDLLHPKYLYYFCQAFDFEKLNTTVTIPSLTKVNLLQIEMDLPSLDEQKRRAYDLDTITKCRELCDKLLDKLKFSTRAKFYEMFGDVSSEQSAFETKKLGDVSKVGSSHRVFTTEFVEEGIPFYRGTEIGELADGCIPKNPFRISEDHYLRLANDETKPQVGDLLMPSICNKGQVWMVDTEEPFYYKDGRVLCISPDRDVFEPVYLQYFMREKTLVEYPKLGSGSTFAEFKIFLLKDMDVWVPPLDLQKTFAEFVESANHSKIIIRAILDKINILYASLIQEYFG